jgi:ABC-2 type transport system ATP-binding protein
MAEVEVRDLTKTFGRVTAVRGVSFTAPAGQVTGFLGPNGSGKTTTLRILLGLVRADAGAALIGGVPYGRLAQRRMVGAMRPLPQWGGGLVLAGYAIAFAAAAMVTTLRRDVT